MTGRNVMNDNPQQAVIDFLADPASHGGAAVKRIDTHAASVFLAGERVLKIKRAVRFPFLDYSTLEKRKKACDAEIEVNRAYAPAIYRGVVPITRAADGTLAIGGQNGEPVEWAVDMRRFNEARTLDHLADKGRIDLALADALGRAVAKAHGIVPAVTDAGFADTLAEIIQQNHDEMRAAADLFAAHDVDGLTAASRNALERLRPLLTARERNSCVRRCHGDLHLGNVVLIDGAPVLFDAIEFSLRLATIDVFYDLAFLLMDLIARDLIAAANGVLNRYLAETRRDGDLDALAALPLFMSLRAAIRAKVTAARPQRDAVMEQSARDYFALALRLIAPPRAMLVAVGGLSGTGKSLLARALAPAIMPLPGAIHLRSDVLRKTLFDVPETERLPASAYTPEVTARVYAVLAAQARQILAAGHSVIVDAVFAKRAERDAVARITQDAMPGTRFHGLFLTADLSVRVARVGTRTGDASDADASIARAQEQYDLGTLEWQQIDASGTPEETLQRGKAALSQ
ncbi:MAG: AAA family ATPase [Pseudolabrys sp.]|nr:AAA family ATPase [Pseudolabrys sp.]